MKRKTLNREHNLSLVGKTSQLEEYYNDFCTPSFVHTRGRIIVL